MRCIACDKLLSHADHSSKQEDGSDENMCWSCIGLSNTEYSYDTDHRFVLEEDSFTMIAKQIARDYDGR